MTANRLFGHAVVGLALGIAACGGDSLTIPSNTGVLEVTTSTTGSEPDPDGYTLQVDADQPQAIGASATLQVQNLTPGTHNVLLSGMAANCSVSGDNPQTVAIAVGEKTSVAFALVCGATTGALQVTAQTSGPSADDGYSISLDGTDQGPLGANASVTLGNLAPGSHVVGLSDVSSNCSIDGGNLQAVTVTPGETASLTFTITCVEPPPAVGTLRITTTTGGADRDPNGYQFSVDGGQAQPIGLNTSATLTNVAAGTHAVVLSDVAGNCAVDNGTSQDVTITMGQTSTVNFVVNCSAIPPTVGTIRVETNTSGPDADNGYTFAIDGGGTQNIGPNASKNVSGVAVGLHTVVLSDVAANCTVDAASQQATVAPGATITVTFNVTCSALPPTTGALHITTTTNGPNPDPNGYKYSVDDGPKHDIAPNGEAFVDNVSAGSHRVELSDVAENCTVPDQSRAVSVTTGGTTPVDFVITCTGVPSASQSTVTANNDNMPVTGSTTITVTVKNAAGDLLSGVNVQPSSDGSGNNFDPGAAQTNQSGVATFVFTSTMPETKRITVVAGEVTLDQKPQIVVTQSSTTTEITGVTPATATSPGDPVHVEFTVTAEGDGTPSGGTVTVFSAEESNTVGCTDVPVSNGSCDIILNAATMHHLTAVYSGNTQFDTSTSNTVTHDVAEPTT